MRYEEKILGSSLERFAVLEDEESDNLTIGRTKDSHFRRDLPGLNTLPVGGWKRLCVVVPTQQNWMGSSEFVLVCAFRRARSQPFEHSVKT